MVHHLFAHIASAVWHAHAVCKVQAPTELIPLLPIFLKLFALAGYSAPITGKNAEERLDLRCAIKTDKFCK